MTHPFKNTESQYGSIARSFHWFMALVILGLLGMGFWMEGVSFSPFKLEVYGFHKSFGLLILGLGVMRLMWRFISAPPPALKAHAVWERFLSKTIHIVFYICILGMPLSGWLMSNAGEHPASFFGLFEMPQIVPKDEALAGVFKQLHGLFAYGLLAAVALHIAGALKHHIIERDSTLRRMGGHMVIVLPLLALFTVAIGVMAYFSLGGESSSEAIPRQAVSSDIDDQTDVSYAPEATGHEWVIEPEGRLVGLEYVQYGKTISGSFESWGGRIIFDPDDLANASVRIEIDAASLDTGSEERNDKSRGGDWFAVERFPKIIFEGQSFKKIDANRYEVDGRLSVRDVTLPLRFPFTLNISQKESGVQKADMSAELSLKRLDFGVGQGAWQTTEAIGNDVKIQIQFTAHHGVTQ